MPKTQLRLDMRRIFFHIILLALLTPAVAAPGGDGGVRGSFDSQSYILKPGDRLNIFINALPELESVYEVRVDGGVYHPIVGQLQAAGRTVDDLKEDFRERLSKELKRPEFRIGLQQLSLHQLSVLGEAKSQGTYEMGVGSTALDLLAKAGGLGEKADRDRAIILRGNKQIEISLEPVENQGLTQMQPGDVLFIQTGSQVSVAGEVQKPGPYSISKTSGSAWDAIIAAGGSKEEAALSRVKLIRPTLPEPLILDLRPEAAHTLPEAGKVLMSGDVVMVPARQAVLLGSGKVGPVPLKGNDTLIDILSQRLGEGADLKHVFVVRAADVFENRDKKEEYNLEAFFKGGESLPVAVPIHDGDLVYVPAKGKGNNVFTSLSSVFSILNIARLFF